MRVDLYRLVHKAQRFHLFSFALDLSRSDLTLPGEQQRIANEVRHIVDTMRDHAHNEETYIHPLLTRVDQRASDSLEHSHQSFEHELEHIVEIVDRGDWNALYPATMRFIGEYLLHIDHEENTQRDILWTRYTDEELGEVLARFRAERSPEKAEADMAMMLPALNPFERAQITAART